MRGEENHPRLPHGWLTLISSLVLVSRHHVSTLYESSDASEKPEHLSYNQKHALSESSCPSLLYPGSSSAGPGWEVSPWQHGRAPVPGEQLIGGEVESDGCGQVAALSEDARTDVNDWDVVYVCEADKEPTVPSSQTHFTISLWTLIASN